MKPTYTFKGLVKRFDGFGGWTYVVVPKKYIYELSNTKSPWGMHPISVRVGKTNWSTKLMKEKYGGYFIALKKDIQKQEDIVVGKQIDITFTIL